MASTAHHSAEPTAGARPFRLLRSMLFVPATSEKLYTKAAEGEADGIILDLEDAVAADRKDAGREVAVAALNGVDWGAKVMAVRINGLDTPHTYRDVIALAEQCPRLDMLVLPMASRPADVQFVATLLEQVETVVPRERPIGMEGIIETPLGAELISDICRAHPRLEALSFGAGDYAAAMGMRNRVIGAADPDYAVWAAEEAEGPQRPHVSDKWHWVMARLANACRAYGLRARDTAYADFRDADGYRAACRRAVALGYEGKSCIHPAQVPIANEVFAPSEAEVTWARSLVEAMETAGSEGKGAVAVGGEMIDLANVRLAQDILAKAERIAARE